MTDDGAPHRRDLNWAVETARIAIVIAIFGQLVISSLPARAIYPTAETGAFDSWGYVAVGILSAISSVAHALALLALPVVGLWAIGAVPRWLHWLAVAASVLIALSILLSLIFAMPLLADIAGDIWYSVATRNDWASVLLSLPYILSVWIAVLTLIAVLAARAESQLAAVLAGIACLIVMAMTLANATQLNPPEGKALVVVYAVLWLWVRFARPGHLAKGAQPWLVALIAVWLLPDVLSLLPRLAEAMQVISPSARWGMVAQIFASIEVGVGLDSAPLALMIIIAIVHMALETPRASAVTITCAALIALGMILPEIAWQRGLSGGFSQMLGMVRSGAMAPGPALFGALAALSWPVAQVALFVASVHLIRLPATRPARP
ncbi:hypothetical protein [Flavimaricola marinus]|uniref:Uncharacterized protein n=1 Tax=Flavimaricola marinus TaxID=1819565 RepID=A0A238LLA2_9RHOB|nr:hypothetical protein [Flavimaricola marinus]SMY09650.1 hypothetical protein LOM8899_03822 [Flavimaricola marinus]